METTSSYFFRITELMTEQEKTLQKETEDKVIVNTIDNPDLALLGGKLREWAFAGFPDGFSIFSIQVTPPSVCGDGVTRNFLQYIDYLCAEPVGDRVQRLQSRLEGIQVTCSYSNDNTLIFHVFKS